MDSLEGTAKQQAQLLPIDVSSLNAVWKMLEQLYYSPESEVQKHLDIFHKFEMHNSDVLLMVKQFNALENAVRSLDLLNQGLKDSTIINTIKRKLPPRIHDKLTSYIELEERDNSNFVPDKDFFFATVRKCLVRQLTIMGKTYGDALKDASSKQDAKKKQHNNEPRPSTSGQANAIQVQGQNQSFLATRSSSRKNTGRKRKNSDSDPGPSSKKRFENWTCGFCDKKGHGIINCEAFLKLKPKERDDYVKKTKPCKPCLGKTVFKHECRALLSPKYATCGNCDKKHNTLICYATKSEPANKLSSFPYFSCHLQSPSGWQKEIVCVLDTCADSNFISMTIAKELSLQILGHHAMQTHTINGPSNQTQTEFAVTLIENDISLEIKAYGSGHLPHMHALP